MKKTSIVSLMRDGIVDSDRDMLEEDTMWD